MTGTSVSFLYNYNWTFDIFFNTKETFKENFVQQSNQANQKPFSLQEFES